MTWLEKAFKSGKSHKLNCNAKEENEQLYYDTCRENDLIGDDVEILKTKVSRTHMSHLGLTSYRQFLFSRNQISVRDHFWWKGDEKGVMYVCSTVSRTDTDSISQFRLASPSRPGPRNPRRCDWSHQFRQQLRTIGPATTANYTNSIIQILT